MTLFIQLLVSGVALGCVFALVASGIVVVARVSGIVNFSQGIYAVVAGFCAASFADAGLPRGVSDLAALAICALLGLVGGIIIMGRSDTDRDASMILSLGFGILLYAPIVLIWGDQPRSLAGVPGSIRLGDIAMSNQYLLIVVVALVVFAGLAWFFGHTYLGKGMTACASDPLSAQAVGISVRRMCLIAFGIAGALGGIAGLLLMPVQPMAFNSDMTLALNGFAAAVFGRLNRPDLAFAGAIVLGVVQSMVAGYVSGALQLPVSLIVLIGLLIWQSRRKVLVA